MSVTATRFSAVQDSWTIADLEQMLTHGVGPQVLEALIRDRNFDGSARTTPLHRAARKVCGPRPTHPRSVARSAV
jgi:hypothetical protein